MAAHVRAMELRTPVGLGTERYIAHLCALDVRPINLGEIIPNQHCMLRRL